MRSTIQPKAQGPASHPSSFVNSSSPLVASVLICDTCWSKPSCANSPAQELLPADLAVPIFRARQRALAERSSCLAKQPKHQRPISLPHDFKVTAHDVCHRPDLWSADVWDTSRRIRERQFDQASGHLPGVYRLTGEPIGHNHHGYPFQEPYRHQDQIVELGSSQDGVRNRGAFDDPFRVQLDPVVRIGWSAIYADDGDVNEVRDACLCSSLEQAFCPFDVRLAGLAKRA